MKKIFLYAILCLSFTQLKAQQGVVFKIKYLPNHNYQMAINVGMKLNATLTGDTSLINKLKAEGITQPVNADLKMAMNGNMKSGSLGADNTFPLNMDFKIADLSVSANGKQAPIPPSITEKDIKVVAHVSQDGKFTIDSAAGKKANDTTQKKMQKMMDIFQKQIQFPDKPLKPGDSFTQSMPMNMPIGSGSNKDVKIDATVTYKLTSISDGKAYFDMVPNFSMDLKIKNTAISVTGTGTGKMVYSIKDNYPLSKDGNFTMKIKVISEKLNVDATAAITTSATTTLN
jgi:hypothetical protein